MASTVEGLKMLLWSIDPVIAWPCRVDSSPSRQTGVHKVGDSGVRLELPVRLTHDRHLSRARPRRVGATGENTVTDRDGENVTPPRRLRDFDFEWRTAGLHRGAWIAKCASDAVDRHGEPSRMMAVA
jgi:hypothetical protein